MGSPSFIEVNGISVDFGTAVLRDGAGKTFVLRPQTLAVLRHLAGRADTLVTKDELMATVWPGVAVTDDSLVQCVHEIRAALGDSRHAILKTVPRRGYRLVLHGDVAPHGAVHHGARRSAWVQLSLPVVVLAAIVGWRMLEVSEVERMPNSVTVLPFTSIGGGNHEDSLAAGITADLATDLARAAGVQVVAHGSESNARYVISGSVQYSDGHSRINARLVETASGRELWAGRYDGVADGSFTLQDAAAGSIVSALAVMLPANGETKIPAVGSGDAHDALAQGFEHLRRGDAAGTALAVAAFERAVERDPGSAAVHAAIAAAQLEFIRLNWYRGDAAQLDGAYAGLNASLEKALETSEPLGLSVAAIRALQAGRKDKALTLVAEAAALAPQNAAVLIAEAEILNATGKPERAEAAARLAMRIEPAFSPAALRRLSRALFHQGKYFEAAETVEGITAQGNASEGDSLTLIAALALAGRGGEAKDALADFNDRQRLLGRVPMNVQEAQWLWSDGLFRYHRPFIDVLSEGLRAAGMPGGLNLETEEDVARLYKGADGAFHVKGVAELSALSAGGLFDRKVPFVDVRSPTEFAKGHVPGAVNLALSTLFTRDSLLKVASINQPVVFYCQEKYCVQSALAAARAVGWGFKQVYRVRGELPAWKEADCPVVVAAKS